MLQHCFTRFRVAQGEAGCITLIVFLASCNCLSNVALPRGAVGWSAVCECGMALSYSFTFKLFANTIVFLYGPRLKKTYHPGFQQGHAETSLLTCRDYLKFEISLVASLYIILSNKGITKTLIRMGGRTSWSMPSCLQTPEDRFSHIKAHSMCTPASQMLIDLIE